MIRYNLLSVGGVETTKQLMDVALGREKADMAIVNADVLNVYTGELLSKYSFTIKGDWIAYVGEKPDHTIGPNTQVIDAQGKTAIPGLIEGHTHLADCLYSPYEFLKTAMTGGTTTIISETIEPFPITGIDGIIDFLDAIADQPIKIFATLPAMVSTSSSIHVPTQEALQKLLLRHDVLGLGEAYWQSVIQEPDKYLPNFLKTALAGKRLEGHTAGARAEKLMAYIMPGISSCHEPINAEEVLDRLRMGLFVMAREGSIRRDLDAIAPIKDMNVDLHRLILATDSVGPMDLYSNGYMEFIVQKAIDYGFKPNQAIQMATINVAEYFGLDGIIGGIAPGKHADILILPDIQTVQPEYVISKGRIIAMQGDLLAPPRNHTFSDKTLHSVVYPRELTPDDFMIKAPSNHSHVNVRVIDQITDLVTKEVIVSLPVINGNIEGDIRKDILKIAAIDRRHSPGKMFVGFIKGYGMRKGAIASSSAWDTSDIVVVGAGEEDMADAVNRIYALQGGTVLSVNGKIQAEIPLPIYGLISDLPLEELVHGMQNAKAVMKDLGCPLADPVKTLATLTGAAIPFIRICEEGLVDIKQGRSVGLFVD
ncbi:MAG: adenine deaminase [Deltaproteobacteria bacterium]|nr:adenine deaminase [Deltaproteobacteria bacterium]